MEEPEHKPEEAGKLRWLLTYADLVTLLLAAFVVLFATREPPKPETIQALITAIRESPTFGGPYASANKPFVGGDGPLDRGKQILPDGLKGEAKKKATEDAPKSPAVEVRGEPRDEKEKVICPAGFECHELPTGTQISMPGELLFDPAQAVLKPSALKTLDQIAGAMVKSNGMVRFEGHTDSDPISSAVFPSNWELSAARAAAVAKHFLNKWNFPPNRVMIAGYGEYQPADCAWEATPKECNKNPQEKQHNRRVVVTITNEPRTELEIEEKVRQSGPSPTHGAVGDDDLFD